jgi:transposase
MKYRTYTNEFKLEAVRLAEQEGISGARVAKDLGITHSLLYDWMRKFGSGGGTPPITPDERDELMRLRRENRILREERDILKKATAFFAKESK